MMTRPAKEPVLDPQRVPHFIIAGVPKSGSTSLAAYLARHPGIFITKPKEPNYFRLADSVVRYRDFERKGRVGGRELPSSEWYQGLFAPARPDQRRGEASITYFWGGRECARRMKTAIPDLRLLFILRHPAEQAYSSYIHMRTRGNERLGFAEALAMEARRKAVPMADMLRYRENCHYHSRLAAFYEVFGPEAIKVMLYDDWRDPATFVREVVEYVGADPSLTPEPGQRHNVGSLPRLDCIEQRISPAASRAGQSLVGTPMWRRLKVALEWLRRINRATPPPLDSRLRRMLTAECREDILKTQALIGRDLTPWLQ